MIDRFLVRIANAHSFLSKLWVLARPYWFAEERQAVGLWGYSVVVKESWIARGLLAAHRRAERADRLHVEAHQRLERALFQRPAGQERGGLLGRAEILGGAGGALHRRLRLPLVADAVPDHPLAALAERGLFPRLAGRPHLLPHGAHRSGHRQPRAAHRAGLRHLHPADALDLARPAVADHDAHHLRYRALEPVGRLRPADLRRHHDPRLHDVGGHRLCAGRLHGHLPDRPAAGARQFPARALQRRLPLPHGAHPRERREHRALSRRAGRGAAPALGLRAHLRDLVVADDLQQAPGLAHLVLRSGRIDLSHHRRRAAVLRRQDPAGRADPDRRCLRPGSGRAVLVRRHLFAAGRLEGRRRPAHHLRRSHGQGQGGRGGRPPSRRARSRRPSSPCKMSTYVCPAAPCCWRTST